ncbi:hypothetical protein T07_13039 [Trichinella nelsoni]|uniref:Uncharacterized protein n=1 Tax=Trichinella nelsoni TaxID=6336 RepID=A0A0V0SGH5_9BILA|nr:hypothetical protein T07_13039 [Trichinella nelsoni]
MLRLSESVGLKDLKSELTSITYVSVVKQTAQAFPVPDVQEIINSSNQKLISFEFLLHCLFHQTFAINRNQINFYKLLQLCMKLHCIFLFDLFPLRSQSNQ